MKPALMKWLVCPLCRGGLRLAAPANGAEEITEGAIVCSGCDRSFPIIRGIPRMLPPELSQEKALTASAFGYEWTHFADLTQQYLSEFLEWIDPVRPEFFHDKVVLDAGCGKGRHAALAARFGAREVIAVDLSNAVEAAYENTRHLDHLHVVQADIYSLPFLQPFDYAYSIGVLHHLPDPAQGFSRLLHHLKPGGRISIWVYGREGNGWIARFVDPLRIHLTSRAPKGLTRLISLLLAVPLYLALKLVYGPVSRRPRWQRLKEALFYSEYLCAISNYSFAENYWNVFDHLAAPTAFYLTREEVAEWFHAAALESVEIAPHHGNSWRGTATTAGAPHLASSAVNEG